MELFGFSAAKIITILLIAILILGPDKVPEMARTVGKTIRDVRRYINGMTQEFNDATGGLRDEITNITSDLRNELAATQADLRSQLDLTGIFTESPGTPSATQAVASSIASTADVVPINDVTPVAPEVPALTETPSPPTAPISVPVEAAEISVTDRPTPQEWATKAYPLADLSLLISALPDNAATVRATATTSEAIAPLTIPIMENAATNGNRKRIGGSVAGTRYVRAHTGPHPSRITEWSLTRQSVPHRETAAIRVV